MTGIKKLCALVLVLMLVVSAGIFTVSGAETSDVNEVAADTAETTGITIHVRHKDLTQPYIYLWNSLPTNSAMSKSYPGEKMTSANGWFNYYVADVTKVNAIVTDAKGNQYSKEQKLTSANEWWCDNGKWSKYNPDETDPVESVDMREETIYFVMTTRFYDGDTGNNVHCWDDGQANNPDSDPAWRGDFKGLADKLDYIKALGFSAIWITPVVTNASGYDYHGYHAMDFSTVDRRYESDNFTYEDLIHAVHDKDMKIIQDVVWQHTGNFGESFFSPLFTKDYDVMFNSDIKQTGKIEKEMVPTDYLLNTFGLNSADEYWGQKPAIQYGQRLNLMKNTTYTGDNGNSTGSLPSSKDYGMDKISDSDIYNPNNYYHTGYFQSLNWDDWTCKYAQIAGDCVDLNTENPAVAEYVVDSYSNYIEMGVDGFRVDTVRHIPRISLNLMYNQQFLDNAKAAGKSNFLMFGEICTRFTQIWYRGHAEESTPYYTWKESNSKWADQWSWGTSAEDINNNMNVTFDHYLEEDDPTDEPTSDNAFLNGIEYHTPDRSMASGMEGIDFQMHRMFGDAKNAYGFAKSNDQYYNDATYNVMYVDSHDYAPEQPQETTRFSGGTQTWAENIDLMFTFRGIPCLYYGSEVEFKKGEVIDLGPNISLENTGRAYFGDYLEGNVTATDFSEYTASGTVADTLASPLSKHLSKVNAIRRAIPALQKGQYTASSNYVSGGNMSYIRRYTNKDEGVDSLALVTVSSGATFKNIPNGTYIDAVTGDVQNVTNGTLTVPTIGKANMRVYVCCASGFTGINGAIGGSSDYLK
ncbi:alpha-amylase family glycosyl hydrolase [Ruminococcus sp.]|uniref:alpha-amylase family glycosyl hydrolase n=1 Tax=Ruminococcus sp. TaxID=41978 RepID=UPI0025D66032|nr:alpha-amylase family glycosyl hydrolase [Ruminococcus sp.]MDD6989092.1 alpha-amylase family glycosyl hydrolase [Ruminococcus sp.]MDY6201165.1 alpha-amylase family glycosyl hydrolase [Ruminococcus sp.]